MKDASLIDFDTLVDTGLNLLGHPIEPKVTRIRSNFYGTSIRIESPSMGLDAHVKANPEHFANEAQILRHFHDVGLGTRFPKLIASSPEGNIVVTQTSGEPMRELFKGKTSDRHTLSPILAHLADALSSLVETQSRASPSAMHAARVETILTQDLPELIQQLSLEQLNDSKVSDVDRIALVNAAKVWLPWVEELAHLELGDYWDHGDFGSGNVLLSGDATPHAVLIDLSEAAINCPCFPASQFIYRLHGHLGIDPASPDGQVLHDFWARKAAERLGLPKSSLERGLKICEQLHIPYSLLMSRRFAKAHKLHTGSLFDNPALKNLASTHAAKL